MPIFQNSNSKFYDPYDVYNLGGFTGKRPDEYTKEDDDEYLAIPDREVGVAENDGTRRISTPDDIVGQAAETAARVGGGSTQSGEETDAWGQTKDAWGQTKDQWGQMYDGPDREPDGDIDDYYRTDGTEDSPIPGYKVVAGKERSAYDLYQDTAHRQPIEGKIPIWKRLVAGAIGGAAGYVNSSGRRGQHVDVSGVTDGILHGDYNRRYKEWQDKVAANRAAAEAEMRRNSDVNQDRRLDNSEAVTRIQQQRADDQVTIAGLKAQVDEIKARAQQTKAGAAVMDAETKRNKINDMVKTYKELNPNATPEQLTAFINGITGVTRTRLSGNVGTATAQQQSGAITADEAKTKRTAEDAQTAALNAAKVGNLQDRGKAALANANRPRGTGSGASTPEQKRGQEIARKELTAARNEIKQVEDEIKALTASANAAKIIRQTYEDAVASKRQYGPEQANKHKDDYDRAGNVLDSIFVGPDGGQTGQYYVLQKRKAELYKKLKELEATYTNNPGWAYGFTVQQPPAPAQPTVQGPPPVTPPPAERKVKRPF